MLAERKMSIAVFKFHSQIPFVDNKISKKRLKGNVSKSVQILMKKTSHKIKFLDCICSLRLFTIRKASFCGSINYSLKYDWGYY